MKLRATARRLGHGPGLQGSRLPDSKRPPYSLRFARLFVLLALVSALPCPARAAGKLSEDLSKTKGGANPSASDKLYQGPPSDEELAFSRTPRQLAKTKRRKRKRSPRLRSSRYLRIRARRLELSPRAKARLLRIAQRYYKATKRKLVITGGTRTPLRQAQLMYGKLAAGENILRLYSAVPVRQIIKAYQRGKKKRHARGRIVRAMRDTIRRQMKRGVYISRHLQAGAADVRSRGMSRRQFLAFRRAVAREPGVILIDERRTSQPHLHLSL